MAELADAHGSGPCEATHGGSNPFDRTNTLYISRVFFYDLTQFLEEKLLVGHLRTYGATLSVLHSESLTLFVQKGKRQKLRGFYDLTQFA